LKEKKTTAKCYAHQNNSFGSNWFHLPFTLFQWH